MKTFGNSLIAALVVGSLGLASDALAGGGGNGGHKSGGFSIGIGGHGGGYGGHGGGYGGHGGGYGGYGGYNNQSCRSNYNYNNYNMNVGQAYEPFHSSYFVQPGDTFYKISLKEYSSTVATNYIPRFNRLATNWPLVVGQQLMLPVISSNGRLTASRAPAAEQLNADPFGTPQGPFTNPVANFTLSTTTPITTTVAPTTVAPVTATTSERLPSVPTGSVLKLDGQSLGTEAGVVRLRISNVAFPVEVVEWAADSTKVRLPKMDVAAATKAELEVVRADGTIASTSAIELTTAAGGLALGN